MSKETTEGQKQISMQLLRNNGCLKKNAITNGSVLWSAKGKENGKVGISVDTNPSNAKIVFDYKVRPYGGEWKSIDYSLSLLSIPCNYGGKRWYFKCNATQGGIFCGKRVSILYLSGDYFVCRKCADLSYESRNRCKSLRHGAFSNLARQIDADKYYEKNVKKRHYAGKMTRQYRRYLKILES